MPARARARSKGESAAPAASAAMDLRICRRVISVVSGQLLSDRAGSSSVLPKNRKPTAPIGGWVAGIENSIRSLFQSTHPRCTAAAETHGGSDCRLHRFLNLDSLQEGHSTTCVADPVKTIYGLHDFLSTSGGFFVHIAAWPMRRRCCKAEQIERVRIRAGPVLWGVSSRRRTSTEAAQAPIGRE
jgi:hypothetical protein